MPKVPRRATGDEPVEPSLPPERDPLAGLENHPLFRVTGAKETETDAHLQALRLAYARLRRAEAEIEELRRQLEATESAKRRLLRQLEAVESELAAWKARGTSCFSGASMSYDFEALFTGELPSSKMTLNDIPLELKTFLTATKAALRERSGVTVTERDQVICSLAAYRLIIEALAPAPHVWRQLAPKDRSRFAARYFGYILEQLAGLLAKASKL